MSDVLAENLGCLRGEIAEAAVAAGRSPADVRLVAVTKTVGVDIIDRLLALGVTDIGENRVQEMKKKKESALGPADWHMIGHLQSNKVRDAVAAADLIHSVDSRRLIDTLAGAAAAADKRQDILLQISLQDDERFGFSPETTAEATEAVLAEKSLRLRGLMTMAPFTDDENIIADVFSRLRGLLDDLRGKYKDAIDMDELSMGMTNDYKIAVREGATLVRVGSALLKGV